MLLFLIIALASFLRLYNMPDRPVCEDVWLWTIGINLHNLPFFNLGAHVTGNFFKSLVYSPYGWADTLPYYLTSGIYNLLNIPLSEFWLYFMHVSLGLVSIMLLFLLGKRLFNTQAGLISAFIFAILPISAMVFGSGLYYHHDFLIFLQLILFVALFCFYKKGTWISSLFLSIALFLNAGTENIIIFPVFILFHYIFEYEACPSAYAALKNLLRRISSFKYILIWLPAISVMILHLYIYKRIGESNLGLIGYTLTKYADTGHSLPGLILLAKKQLAMIYGNFLNWYALIILFLAVLHVIYGKNNYRVRVLGLMAWISYIFFVNVFFRQGQHLLTFRYSLYLVPILLLFGYMTYRCIEWMRNFKTGGIFKKGFGVVLVLSLVLILAYITYSDIKYALNRKIYHSPLKSVAFYVREHGNRNSTVFQLIPSTSSYNYQGEYYFGKLYMEPGDETGFKRQLFSFGKYGIDDYKKAYGLKDFDFYIEYHGQDQDDAAMSRKEDFLRTFPECRLNKVAYIIKEGKKVATIYSPRDLPFETVDAYMAEKSWDKKYANIKNLLQNNWCGLAVLWGYHHRIH